MDVKEGGREGGREGTIINTFSILIKVVVQSLDAAAVFIISSKYRATNMKSPANSHLWFTLGLLQGSLNKDITMPYGCLREPHGSMC